eukprot:COSAG03_NODE_18789_length_348_cov_1.156627_1_plen_40_part_10
MCGLVVDVPAPPSEFSGVHGQMGGKKISVCVCVCGGGGGG